MGSGGIALPNWHRVVLELRNTRNTFAREHPLFVFHAIAKHAARTARLETPWLLFPLAEALQARIQRGQVYRLAWVMPSASISQTGRLVDGVARWLEDPSNNFELASTPKVEPRSLHVLCEEASQVLGNGLETTLDFLTPFGLSGHAANGALSPTELGAICTARLARIAPWFTPPPESAWRQLRLLTWFWQRSPRFEHISKSQPGQEVIQWLQGFLGPLFVRGDLSPVLPALLLASEFTMGDRLKVGEGRFVLRPTMPLIDARIAQPSALLQCWETLRASSDLDLDELADAMTPPDALAARTVGLISSPGFTFSPATQFAVPKSTGGQRLLHQLAPLDIWIQKTIHRILSPVLDSVLRPEVLGYRPAHSTQDARPLIQAAVKSGCTHVLETDISRFFDTVDWCRLDRAIDDFLPLADTHTRNLLRAAIRQDVRLRDQSIQARSQGLLQGSPLSPLLANLFLTIIDDGLAAAGLPFIRFADDILILTRSHSEADQARTTLENLLNGVGLSLNPSKCRITPLDLGFEYLGQHFDADLTAERILATRIRHPLWIRRPFASLGVDGDVLLVRQDRTITDRIPLHRVSELILINVGAVGIHLLHRCRDLGIPVALCDASGRFQQLIDAAARSRVDTVGRHFARHSALRPDAQLGISKSLVEAKLHNYARWFQHVGTDPCRHARSEIERVIERLPDAGDLSSLRGFEGYAARETFGAIRTLLRQDGFASAPRVPGQKPDPFNALLDFGYTQLFVRIETLLHIRGLNPWLGLLHDPANHYPSLVCDLQEPFRARVDRWAVKTINRREITLQHFESVESPSATSWRITRDAWPILLESFAREELIGLAHESHAWIDQLAAQVRAVQEWAVAASDWQSYKSPSRPNPNAEVQPESAGESGELETGDEEATPPTESA